MDTVGDAPTFKVGLTRDLLGPDGVTLGWGDIGLATLEELPWVDWEFLATDRAQLTAADVAGYDALIVNGPRITAATVAGNDRLSVIARFGVGYDTVDVKACAARGIPVTITPDGVRRPVASSVLCLLLALAHRLLDKDRITRDGQWDSRLDLMGRSLTAATVGLVGYGNIGREVAMLLAPFSVRLLIADPALDHGPVAGSTAEAVDLPTLLRESDFVVLLCPLTPSTFHLIGPAELGLMKDTGYLVNVSRGPVLDQAALVEAMRSRTIAGAALDVFESEPLPPTSPLIGLPEVILTPHSLCWNDEMALGCGHSVIRSVLKVARGQVPDFVVAPEALTNDACVRRLAENALFDRPLP